MIALFRSFLKVPGDWENRILLAFIGLVGPKENLVLRIGILAAKTTQNRSSWDYFMNFSSIFTVSSGLNEAGYE